MASTGYKKGKFTIFGSLNHDKTDGHRDSSSFNITNGFLKAGYKLNEHLEASADFNIADFRSIDPGRTDQTVNAFIADMTRGKASLSIRNKYAKFEGGLFGFFNYGDHSFSDNWRSHDENYGLSVYQGLKLFKGSLITAGFDFKTFGGRGNIAFPPTNANKWLYVEENAGYLIARQSVKEVLDISAGIRLEKNSLFGTEWVPQFGLAYHVTESLSLKASASEGFRSPTIMELYLFAPNPELKPENIQNYEAGVEGRFLDGKLNAELTLYYLEGSNIILSQPNPTPPPPFKRFNTGAFNHKGFEMEASFKSAENLDFDFTYSYLSMDKPKLVAPAHQAYAGANYKIGKFALNAHLSYVGDLLIVDAVNDADDVYESFLLVNAGLKYFPKTWIELFVSGKNLGNAEYSIENGYPMPGINVMTGIGLKF
jgi:iron complex outermembrane receptor protein